jgi:hypothetical protein
VDRDRILTELKAERDRLNSAIAALEGITAPRKGRRTPKAVRVPQKRGRRGGISAAGRAKLARLMKQRWAARKKAGKTKL